MSDLPFRVWDVLQEMINNDELPEGCDVRIRAFYVNGHCAFVFGNDAEMLVDVIRKRTVGNIRDYGEKFGLSLNDKERFFKILA